MRIVWQKKFLFLLVIAFLSACLAKQDGTVEGTIVPPGAPAHITALMGNKEIVTVAAGEKDGRFRLSLPAGVYTINITVPSSPYPLCLNNIVVKAGETTTLSPVDRTQTAGKSILCGKVTPPRPDAEVKLLYEGKERAAVHTDTEGKYEFKELPAGTYVMQANAPGHANDAAQVVITENQKVEQNAVLLPITPIDGVDWAAGKIRAVGTGTPPQNAANETVRREMTKRAALADAQRNMVRTIEQIRINAGQTVKTAMNSPNIALKVQGFLKGYTVVSERQLDDGKIEVILELPLTGPAGLSRYVTE
jgi:hypothetical protein